MRFIRADIALWGCVSETNDQYTWYLVRPILGHMRHPTDEQTLDIILHASYLLFESIKSKDFNKKDFIENSD